MNATTAASKAHSDLVETAALRIAQMGETGRTEVAIAEVVRLLREAFLGEWREVYGPNAVRELAERFGVACDNPTLRYFNMSATHTLCAAETDDRDVVHWVLDPPTIALCGEASVWNAPRDPRLRERPSATCEDCCAREQELVNAGASIKRIG